MPNYDFQGLSARLLGQAESLLPNWLPGGRREGREWVCADLSGSKGKTLKVNLDKGMWHDFASGDGGGDLIDLFANIRNIGLGQAFRELSNDVGFIQGNDYTPPAPMPEPKPETGPPPSEDVLKFSFETEKLGKPKGVWIHRDEVGKALMVAARYDYIEDGEQAKAVLPWSWHLRQNRWVMRALGYPAKRPQPLYGTEKLALNPGKQVLVVEGAKKAEAAQRLVGTLMVVMSWPGGSSAVRRCDWSVLAGRSVVLWPDADLKHYKLAGGVEGELKPYEEQPGPKAMQIVGELLKPLCPSVKIVDVGLELARADGWDAADAESEGWDTARLLAWIKPRARLWTAEPIVYPGLPKVALEMLKQAPKPVAEVVAPPLQPIPTVTLEVDEGPQMTASTYATWERLNIATTRGGQPYYNTDNCLRFITNETLLENYLWYDDFHCKLFTQFDIAKFKPLASPREWTEMDEIELMIHMQRHVGLVKMNLDMVRQGVKLYASKNVRNEPREWLNGLVWDGQERIEAFLAYAFGVENSHYVDAASKNWLMSIAARVLMPGCKVDTMLILRGEQGARKSMALRALGGQFFSDVNVSVENPKDFAIALHGKLIVELAELTAFTKAGAEAVKKMLSTQTDDYRPVFGKYNINHPRYTVFAGSTNETFFLNDPTGARRFWPITCTKINVPWIEENREQLFAEAAVKVRNWMKTREDKDGWWEMPALETKEVQELHRQFDEWENLVAAWLNVGIDGLAPLNETTTGDVLHYALGIEKDRWNKKNQGNVGRIMAIFGWQNKVVNREGISKRVWVRAQ